MKVRIVRNKKQILGEYEVQYQTDGLHVWTNIGKYGDGGILVYCKTYDKAMEMLNAFEEKVKDDCPHVVYEKKIENIKE